MFGKLGLPELLIILVIVLVLFGANKLPQLGAGLGQSIRGFKKALGGDEDDKSSAPPTSTPTDQGSSKP
jgi:sec-independent protein translocase protein TatA